MHTAMTRRDMLRAAGAGFGYLALRGLATAADKPAHHKATAKRVIFLFMHGGPSQVDTFDYKPRLQRDDGKELPFAPAKGTTASRKLMASPWKFRQHGQSGAWASELFPHVAKHADDLCFLKGMHTDGQSHGQAVLKLHTGAQNLTRPSLGSWLVYGLRTENQSLPGFVTICPPRGHGGALNYGNAFLPASYQGTAIGHAGTPASKAHLRDIVNEKLTPKQQRKRLDLLQAMNRAHQEKACDDAVLHSGFEPAAYAEALFAVAKTSTSALLPGCPMTTQMNVKTRIVYSEANRWQNDPCQIP